MDQNREVRISGDANGNTIITGDGNLVVIVPSHHEARMRRDDKGLHETFDNPYRGLAPFYEEDSPFFFGRDDLIETLTRKFRKIQRSRSTDALRTLAVIGPSGCGKTSVLRAGLIPALAQNPLPGFQNQRIVVFSPGDHPLMSLAVALSRVAGRSLTIKALRVMAAELGERDEDGEYHGVARFAESIPHIDTSPLVIVVDQLEALYSPWIDSEEQQAFISSVLFATMTKSSRVSAIVSVRQDFLDRAQQNAVLSRAISRSSVIIPMMNRTEIVNAISTPAKLAGHPLDSGTIESLTDQVYGRQGALPLLQAALSMMWEEVSKGEAPGDALTNVGGLGGVIAKEAQARYEELSSSERRIAKRAFLAMANLEDMSNTITRRQVSISEITAHGEDPASVLNVLREFAWADIRFITITTNSLANNIRTEDYQVEITHEALFEHWDTLRDWISSSRSDIVFRRRLSESQRRWQDHNHAKGLLWRPPEFEYLKEYYYRAQHEMSKGQIQFYFACRSHNRNRRFIGAATVLAFLILAGTGTWYWWSSTIKDSEIRRKEIIGAIHSLIDAAQAQHRDFQQDELAALLANQAVNFAVQAGDSAGLRKAKQTVRELIASEYLSREYEMPSDYPTPTFTELSSDGELLATYSSAPESISFWDVSSNTFRLLRQELLSLSSISGPPGRQPEIQNDGNIFGIIVGDGDVELWSVSKHDETTSMKFTLSANVLTLRTIVNGGKELLTENKDGSFSIWEKQGAAYIESANVRSALGDPTVSVLSPNGRYFAISNVGNIEMWDFDLSLDHAFVTIALGQIPVFPLVFSPDSSLLAVGDYSGAIRVWATSRLSTEPTLLSKEHDGFLYTLRFADDNKLLVSGGGDGKVILWNLANSQGEILMHRSDFSSINAAFNKGATQLTLYSGSRIIWRWVSNRSQSRTQILTGLDAQIVASDNHQVILQQSLKRSHLDVRRIEDLNNPILSLDFSNPFPEALTISSDGTFISFQRGFQLSIIDLTQPSLGRSVSLENSYRISANLYTANGEFLVLVGVPLIPNGRNAIWTVNLRRKDSSPQLMTYFPNDAEVELSADQLSLLVLSRSRGIGTIDLAGEFHEIEWTPISSLNDGYVLSDDHRMVAVLNYSDWSLSFWNLTNHQYILKRISISNSSWGGGGTFSSDGREFAFVDYYGGLWLVDLQELDSGADSLGNINVGILESSMPSVFRFSRDAKYLLMAYKGQLRLWNLEGSDKSSWQMAISSNHTAIASAFSSEDKEFALEGDSKRIEEYDVSNIVNLPKGIVNYVPNIISTNSLLQEREGINVISYISNDSKIFVGGSLGSVLLLTPTSALSKELCELVARNLSYEEWMQYVGSRYPYERTCQALPAHPTVLHAAVKLASTGDTEGALALLRRLQGIEPEDNIDPKETVDDIIYGVQVFQFFDKNKNNLIDDIEILTVIEYYEDQKPVPGIGAKLSDKLRMTLTEYWVSGWGLLNRPDLIN